MPSKVTRQPYTECPYSWSLDVGGISGGEGVVSEAQCAELAGDFVLDFKACASTGDKLVWAGDCETGAGGGPGTCGESRYLLTVSGITGPEEISLLNGTFILSAQQPDRSRCHTENVDRNVCVYETAERITSCDGTIGPAWYMASPGVFGDPGGWYLIGGLGDGVGLGTGTQTQWIIYKLVTGLACFPGDLGFSFSSSNCDGAAGFPTSLTAVDVGGTTVGLAGPLQNDRIRSKWHLEYSITDAKWTLRSFSYIDYPVYELLDANPCEGESKTLVLAGRPDDAEDGCGVAPPEVTINRVCAPVAVATERRQRQTSTRLMNHKFHLCGCDCGDQVNDERGCASQCASTTTEGCETYPEEGVECRFPISADCCGYCDDQETSGKHDPPCAYEALFDCDIEHDGEQIAASVVTLRHECYFENSCQWVAVGPSPNEEDGFVGKQPVCATCADDCLTGCSWSSWQVAECPLSPFCDVTADKTKCLEFRWENVQSTSFTTATVAAVLRFSSETILSTGAIHWVFTSDDGEWTANIYPNAVENMPVGCFTGQTCGYGNVTWSNPTETIPCGAYWPSKNWSQPNLPTDGVCQGWDIADDGVYFDGNGFGTFCTTLRMYWIDCP